jgi:hypothetical protein
MSYPLFWLKLAHALAAARTGLVFNLMALRCDGRRLSACRLTRLLLGNFQS